MSTIRIIPTLLVLVAAVPVFAQVEAAVEEPLEAAPADATEAIDVAEALKLEAAALSVGTAGSRTVGEEKLQAQVDRMAALAASLEADIRSGADKNETRPIYEELRKARLEALGLAMTGQAEIAPEDAAFFELLVKDLGSYHDAK